MKNAQPRSPSHGVRTRGGAHPSHDGRIPPGRATTGAARLLWSALLWAAFAPLMPGKSLANPPTVAEAKVLLDAADLMFQAGQYEPSLAAYIQAQPLGSAVGDPAGIQWNIARCLEELGRVDDALTAFDAYLRLPDDEEGYAAARKRIADLERTHFARLKVTCDVPDVTVEIAGRANSSAACPGEWSRLPAGTLQVIARSADGVKVERPIYAKAGGESHVSLNFPATFSVRTTPEGARVYLGDVLLGITPLEGAAVAVGTHTLRIERDGHIPEHRQLSAVSGKLHQLDLRLVAMNPAAPAATPARRSPTAVRERTEPASASSTPVGAWLATGGAVAALVGGGVLLKLAGDKFDEAQEKYDQGYNRASVSETKLRKEVEAKVNNGKTYAISGYALLGVGAAAAGVAIYLFATHDNAQASAPPTPTGPTFALAPEGGLSVGWTGHW